jgi:hypothetical protein
MAKRQAKQVSPTARALKLDLDGKSHVVEFNFRAYAAMKELTGISLIRGWDPTTIDAKEIACLLYAGLLTHHRDIDLEFCFSTLRMDNLNEVYGTLLAAYRASLPKPKEDENPPKPVSQSK